MQLSVREALNSKKEEFWKGLEAESYDDDDNEDEAHFDARMRQQILRKRNELGDLPPKPKLRNGMKNFSLGIFQILKFPDFDSKILGIIYLLGLSDLLG